MASLAHAEAEVRAKEADKAEALWRGGQAVTAQRSSPRKGQQQQQQYQQYQQYPTDVMTGTPDQPRPPHDRTPPPQDSPRARSKQQAEARARAARRQPPSNEQPSPSKGVEANKVADARTQAAHMSRLGPYGTTTEPTSVSSRLPPLNPIPLRDHPEHHAAVIGSRDTPHDEIQ